MLPLVVLGAAAWYLSRPQRNPDWITVEGKHIPLRHGDGRAGDPTPYDDAKLGEKWRPTSTARTASAAPFKPLTESDIPIISGDVTVAHVMELLRQTTLVRDQLNRQEWDSRRPEAERKRLHAAYQTAGANVSYLRELLQWLQDADNATLPTASKSLLRQVTSNFLQSIKRRPYATRMDGLWDSKVTRKLGDASKDAKARLTELPKGTAPPTRGIDENWRNSSEYRQLRNTYRQNEDRLQSGDGWTDFARSYKIPTETWSKITPTYNAYQKATLTRDAIALESRTKAEYDSITRRGGKSALRLRWLSANSDVTRLRSQLGTAIRQHAGIAAYAF